MSDNNQKKNTLNDFLGAVGDASKTALDGAVKFAQETAIPAAQDAAKNTKKFTEETIIPGVQGAAKQASSAISKAQQDAFNAVDQNGDGKIDIEDVINLALKVPGVRINRADFLRKEFTKNYESSVIEDAIKYNPAHAGISVEEIDKIADEVIELERRNVSGISAALGLPGGLAMAATIPTDIAQYYGFMIRAMQKLMYLYGWPELAMDENNNLIDSETMNIITLCLGVMYGVNGAVSAIKVISNGLAKGVSKKIMDTALTKGVVYPILKKVLKWFSVNLTKNLLSQFAEKAIPVVGGVIGGGITYASFKPCCDRLKNSLRDTLLSNPNSKTAEVNEEDLIVDAEIEEKTEE